MKARRIYGSATKNVLKIAKSGRWLAIKDVAERSGTTPSFVSRILKGLKIERRSVKATSKVGRPTRQFRVVKTAKV